MNKILLRLTVFRKGLKYARSELKILLDSAHRSKIFILRASEASENTFYMQKFGYWVVKNLE